jgi:hypothetical protein
MNLQGIDYARQRLTLVIAQTKLALVAAAPTIHRSGIRQRNGMETTARNSPNAFALQTP